MQESTVVGKICHIKASNPRGPRYDPQQAAAERHGYDNLVLLCGKHHTVIDDDEEAYTVERLVKMKADHESRAARVDDDFAERAAQLLINQPVISMSQSGGITARTIYADTINLHPPSVPPNSGLKFKKHHTVVIDFKNTTAARFLLKGNAYNGNIGILFYGIRIVNSIGEGVTLKTVNLHYNRNGKHFSSESHVLLTGSVYSPNNKGDIDLIIMRCGVDNIVLMNWTNLRVEIGKNNILPPGGILAASAAFILDFKDASDLAKLRDLSVSVTDYSGNEL